jgi:hypothetical protein
MSLKNLELFFTIIVYVFINVVRLEDLVFSKQTRHVLATIVCTLRTGIVEWQKRKLCIDQSMVRVCMLCHRHDSSTVCAVFCQDWPVIDVKLSRSNLDDKLRNILILLSINQSTTIFHHTER